MAELVPAPFPDLVNRMCYELAREDVVFHLPRRNWWLPDPDGPDLSVTFHDHTAGTPVGPAAGPQTQMAQNIVLSWLAGSRIMELKTVQINDRLTIGRPCIDATNIGFNIEWSQELRISQSLEQYVAGAMLIHMLTCGGLLGESPITHHAQQTLFDISLGYDFAGISSRSIRSFVRQLRDAGSIVERLRNEIPRERKTLRNLDYPTRIASSITLSTFHGCPADEIERICEFLITDMDCDVIVKMNPPMLGKERLEHLLHDVLGYTELHVPDRAYRDGLQFDESLEVCGRLASLASSRGRGFGVKFSNTLEVENHRDFFASDNKTQYLSGQPLHVITLTLSHEFRKAVGPEIPLTFSAGVDRFNFANMVACGFCPVTTCTDLLRPGGYGRLPAYLAELVRAMNRVEAGNIDEYILKANCDDNDEPPAQSEEPRALFKARAVNRLPSTDQAPVLGNARAAIHPPSNIETDKASSIRRAAARNLAIIVRKTQADPRYRADRNRKAPKRIDSHLDIFDCLTCDKCIPVCPNAANFLYATEPEAVEFCDYVVDGANLKKGEPRKIVVEQADQIANFADFCNDCGNCDTFCPEYDGPFIKKPNFFGSLAAWQAFPSRDGFYIDAVGANPRIYGRMMGKTYMLKSDQTRNGVRFEDGTICLFIRGKNHSIERWFAFGPSDATGHVINMTAYHTMRILHKSLLRTDRVHQVNVQVVS